MVQSSQNKVVQVRYSIKLIDKVMKILLRENAIGRTGLSQASNIHYARLVDQLAWLENRNYIKFIIKDGKIAVELTPEGRQFALVLSTIDDD